MALGAAFRGTTFRDVLRRLVAAPRRQRVTMILGMHRSGTSFLAGSLQQAGLELGRHSAWNPYNTRGNRENDEIVALHDAILACRGFAWNRPPFGPFDWTAEELGRARAIIEAFRGVPHWGFKDPRSLLVVDGWQALLPGLGFVGVFRHPAAVARSLAARGAMPAGDAFGLWLAYNRRLIALHRRRRFPVISFDDPPEALLGKLDRVSDALGLSLRPAERFYSDELRHHRREEVELPAEVAATLHELQRIAI
jgi:hypothetical protein